MPSTPPLEANRHKQLHIERLSIADEHGSAEATTLDKDVEKRLLRKLDLHIAKRKKVKCDGQHVST